jgi:ribosomal protein L40E
MLLRSVYKYLSDKPPVIRECRDCGAKLDAQATACPICGSTEIATIYL